MMAGLRMKSPSAARSLLRCARMVDDGLADGGRDGQREHAHVVRRKIARRHARRTVHGSVLVDVAQPTTRDSREPARERVAQLLCRHGSQTAALEARESRQHLEIAHGEDLLGCEHASTTPWAENALVHERHVL